MKKMKKLLAMMLAVVMVVGAVNLPTKAAGESEATAIALNFGIHGAHVSNSGLLLLTIDGLTIGSGEPTFTAVSTDAQVTYNGVACTATNQPRTISAGMYLAVDEVSNGVRTSGAETGDIVNVKGIWQYTSDSLYYDFGDVSFMWDGTSWQALGTVTDLSFGIHGAHVSNSGLLLLTIDGLTIGSGEPTFTAVSTDAQVTYNGVACTATNQPRTISAGMYLAVDEVSNGVRTSGAETGDIVNVKGIWQYTSDNKYYNFGDVSFKWNGSNWEALGTVTDVTFGIHGGHVGNKDLLLLTTDGLTIGSGEPIFTAVSIDAQLTYNGVACTATNQPRTISAGMYLAVNEVSNNVRTSGAETGDIIRLCGVWQYTSDNKYYNFGDVSFKWNGSNWEEYVPIVSTDVTFGIHGGHVGNKELLLLTTEDITIASEGEPIFTAVSEDATLTYNGVACTATNQPRTISAGLYLAVNEVSNNVRTSGAETGDIIRLCGVWQYTSDNKYYNFGDVSFKWNGSNWEEYVPAASTDVTFSIAGHANSDTLLLLVPSGMTVAEGEPVFTAVEDAVATYNGVALKKLRTAAGGIYLDVSGISDNAKATRKDVIRLSGIWNYTGDNQNYNFGDVSYVFDGVKWSEGATVSDDFTITGIGTCTEDDGYNLEFTTDNVIASSNADGVTLDETFDVLINGESATAVAYATESHGFGLYLESNQVSKGTVVVISSTSDYSVGGYKLTNTYSLIYDNGTWQEYHTPTPVTLEAKRFEPNLMTSEGGSFYYTAENSGVFNGQEWQAAYSTSGIFYNGTRLENAKLVCYSGSDNPAHFYITRNSVTTGEFSENDFLTVKGVFYAGDSYVDISEVNFRYTGSAWEVTTLNYDHLIKTDVKEMNGAWSGTFNQWLFRIKTSVPLEEMEGDFAGGTNLYSGTLTYTITPVNGEGTSYTETTLYHAQLNGQNGCLGIVVKDRLPEESSAGGYKITINSASFISANYAYELRESYTYVLTGGSWVQETNRPTKSGIFADANGKDGFNAADLVAVLKEYTGIEEDGTSYLCTTDALIAGKSKVQLSDVIRIREELLDYAAGVDKTETGAYTPVYLDDTEITLAAYRGPGTDGFALYKAAGFNTLIADGADDSVSFSSEGEHIMGAGSGAWTNVKSYMDAAKDTGLNVYMASEALNAYLKNVQATKMDQSASFTVTDDLMQQDLTQMLVGTGTTHAGIGLADYDNFKGIMFADELDYTSLSYYTTAAQFMKSINPDLETFGSFESYGSDIGTDDYELFATAFAGASTQKSFTYDYYPYYGGVEKEWLGFGNGGYTYNYDEKFASWQTDWLSKLERVAGYGKKGDFDTGITLQSSSWKNTADKVIFANPDTKAEIGYQVYTALAYGMKSINYFLYCEPKTAIKGEEYVGALVMRNDDGTTSTTATYDSAKEVNTEIKKFDHVFLDYDWVSTIKLGSSTQLTGLAGGSSDRISNSSVSAGSAIIGCMYDSEKALDGFWIVNATAPTDNTTSTVNVTFNNATRAMVYNPAAGDYGKLVSLTAGAYTATLASGAGQFIIPLP